MNTSKPVTYTEMVLPRCSLTYGSGACTASIGVTGDFKCYNSPSTCQDISNYDDTEELVVRWAKPTEDLDVSIEAAPCMAIGNNPNIRPMVIDPGESFGVRESVTVTCQDFLDNGYLFDKYLADRDHNTYNRGTYFGKLLARWENLEGYEIRVIRGYVGQQLSEMKKRYYIIDSVKELGITGKFSLVAKDAAKFADSDKAQWPKPSGGTLAVALTDATTTFDIEPAGVGDLEYPANGTASIGNEKVTFTRVADSITLTGRGLSGSEQVGHEEGDTFQLAAVYSAQNPAEIIDDILANATDLPSEYRDLAVWEEEVNEHLGRLYSAEIMQPTSVKTLINEMVKEAGLNFYIDTESKKFILEVLRQRLPVVNFSDDNIFPSTLKSKPLKNKRISQVWIYYGRKNPLENMDEKKNYSVIYADFSTDSTLALQNNPQAIREIMSRWITQTNRPAAESCAQRLISGFERAPVEVSFASKNLLPIKTGSTISVQSRLFTDSQGSKKPPFNAYVTSLKEVEGQYMVTAQEIRFSQVSPPSNDRVINVDVTIYDSNLRTIHDQIYTPPVEGNIITLVISAGVTMGSTDISIPALDIGSWPSGVVIQIDGDGRIQGKGGNGSSSLSASAGAGEDGGDAILTTYPIEIIGDIEIWAGGGAGGGGTPGSENLIGGGGAGNIAGSPGASTESGGTGGNGAGAGGAPGLFGFDGTFGDGGSPGNAIDGNSFVTITASPDIKGPLI